MTDITELAQREKFEAWAEEAGALPWGILKKHRNQDGSYPGPHYTYMWKAWQAASAELVEALEKAQTEISSANRVMAAQDSELTTRRQRIAELENSELQLIDERDIAEDALGDMYQAATGHRPEWSSAFGIPDAVDAVEQRLGELESRTVTVKLPPKIERNDIDGWFTYKGGRVGGGAAEWYNKALDDVGSELTAAGIKWEGA